jgi:hypothetical protein
MKQTANAPVVRCSNNGETSGSKDTLSEFNWIATDRNFATVK